MRISVMAAAAGGLLLLSGAGAAVSASEPEIRIDSYSIEAEVESDGSLRVVETVTFASGATVPDGFQDNLATWRVSQGSESLTTEGISIDIPAANPSRITATYTVTGAFRAFTAADLADGNPLSLKPGDAELLAEVIGPLGDAEIAEARVDIGTPGAALAAACFVDGQSIPVCTDRIGDEESTFRSLNIPPGSSMTIAMVIDGEDVSLPDSSGDSSGLRDISWGWTLLVVSAGLALGAFIAGVIFVRRRSGTLE